MTEPEWPYNLPIFRSSLRRESPDGRWWAEIGEAVESYMGNPTMGTLELSTGVTIERCNPSFIWSDDSRFLTVPQYSFSWFFGIGKQRLLIIDVDADLAWISQKLAYYLQPEAFKNGVVAVTLNPTHNARTVDFNLSDILETFKMRSLTPE